MNWAIDLLVWNRWGKMPNALECDISALIKHEPIYNFEIFQIIFDYDELLELRPLIEKSTKALISQDMNFKDFLKEWDEFGNKHYNGEITAEKFKDWKLSYPKNLDLKNNRCIKNTIDSLS